MDTNSAVKPDAEKELKLLLLLSKRYEEKNLPDDLPEPQDAMRLSPDKRGFFTPQLPRYQERSGNKIESWGGGKYL